jgi:hypothetical protein
MQLPSIKPVSPYLNSPHRSLYDVCRTLGRDDHGRACAACRLLVFCLSSRADPSADRQQAAALRVAAATS